MPSYTTVENTLKKLESRQSETDKHEYCGVIYADNFEKLVIPTDKKGNRSKAGYLVVPRPPPVAEWGAACTR